VQVLQVLPDSVFYGRHLLREGDYIRSVNGRSVEQLSSADCDELLVPRSVAFCIEMLRRTDARSPSDGPPDPEWENPAEEDGRLERHGGPELRRCSLPNELNQNELFARSKLRLSYRSGFDRESPRGGRDLERDFTGDRGGRTSSGRRMAPDSGGPVTPRLDPENVDGSVRIESIEGQTTEPALAVTTGPKPIPSLESMSFDHDEDASIVELTDEPQIEEIQPRTPVDKSLGNVEGSKAKRSKGVQFKLSSKDRNAKLEQLISEALTLEKCFDTVGWVF